jgi:hypothetical protein
MAELVIGQPRAGTNFDNREYAFPNPKELPMRSSAMARRFGIFSAVTLAGAAVLVFHTAALAQQNEPKQAETKAENKAETNVREDSTKDVKTPKDASNDAKEAPLAAPEAGAEQAPQELPPGYALPPGYRNGPPQGYPQPPADPYYRGPYQHDRYYGPPPSDYPYPPPRYSHRYAPPPAYYPDPIGYRPFFFGFGLGVSGVAIFPNQSGFNNEARMGLGYTLRLGFGLSPHWSLVLAADGATAYFDHVSVNETVFTIGPQVWLTHKLYARAGIGAASRSYDHGSSYDRSGYYYDYGIDTESGMGGVGAVGLEFMQSYHFSLAVEANGTVGYFPNKETLSTFGINFVMNLF